MFINFFQPSNHHVFSSLKISTFYLQVQANETQFTQFKHMQFIHSSAIYFLSLMSVNYSCVILPLFPTNKVSIYLIKTCTPARNPTQYQLWKTHINISNITITCNILLLLWLQDSDYTSQHLQNKLQAYFSLDFVTLQPHINT